MMEGKKKRADRHAHAAGASLRLRSLLVAVDLTAHSDRVLRRVPWLPLAPGARLTLLHVIPSTLSISERRSAERDAKRRLREEARLLAHAVPFKVHVEAIVKVGSAATVIASTARAVHAELLVMGRGGPRGLRDIFLGSTAERVIRRCQRPVLVVRLPARAAYRRLALALDLDKAAQGAASLLLRLVPPARPVVWVIHALSVPYQSLAYPSLPRGFASQRNDGLHHRTSKALGKVLDQALTHARIAPEEGPIWNHRIRLGSPHTVIGEAVKAARTELLVLGTHGYTGVGHVFLGTVAGDILRAVTCDVLVVPPPRKASTR
jgi:nucleotide-binding universal stress UspA family protein